MKGTFKTNQMIPNPMAEADRNLHVIQELNNLETYKNLFGISMSKTLATERQLCSGSRRLHDFENSSHMTMELSRGTLGKMYNQDFMGKDDILKFEPEVHQLL